MILVLKNATKFRQVALHAYLCTGASGALYNFAKWYAGGAIYCNFIRLAPFQNNGSLIVSIHCKSLVLIKPAEHGVQLQCSCPAIYILYGRVVVG